MNREELVAAVAEKADITKAAAWKAVDAMFDAIAAALKSGQDVRITGFGTFSVSERAASEGRNPRTGEPVQIAASRRARWKPGVTLKRKLNPAPLDRAGPPTPRRAEA